MTKNELINIILDIEAQLSVFYPRTLLYDNVCFILPSGLLFNLDCDPKTESIITRYAFDFDAAEDNNFAEFNTLPVSGASIGDLLFDCLNQIKALDNFNL